jgi:hypothetical protein
VARSARACAVLRSPVEADSGQRRQQVLGLLEFFCAVDRSCQHGQRLRQRAAWGSVSDNFERRLAEQESSAVIAPRIDRETRRGRDYVRAVIVVTVDAADVAEALDLAWWVFRKATGDDLAGWDLASAEDPAGRPVMRRWRGSAPQRIAGPGTAAPPLARS